MDNKQGNQNMIVQYSNEFNKINLKDFNALEMNLLFSALLLTKERGEDEVVITYKEIAQLAGLKKTNVAYVHNMLLKAKQKIFNLSISPQFEASDAGTNLKRDFAVHVFETWDANPDTKTLTLGVSQKGLWILNGLNCNFTAFELIEFISLKTNSAKKMFKFLKQWKTLGKFQFNSVDELRAVLEIPNDTKDHYIFARIIGPAIQEITEKTESFRGLTCKGIHTGKNHKLAGCVMQWIPESTAPAVLPPHLSPQIEMEESAAVLFRLKNETLSDAEYAQLKDEFGEETADKTIRRVLEKPYIGCLNMNTLRTWCREDQQHREHAVKEQKKRTENKFHNFEERKYDYAKLEEILFQKGRENK